MWFFRRKNKSERIEPEPAYIKTKTTDENGVTTIVTTDSRGVIRNVTQIIPRILQIERKGVDYVGRWVSSTKR
jgi:hypothetical protein